MRATADQVGPAPRRYMGLRVGPSCISAHAPRTYLSTVRRPAEDPMAVLSPDALKLRRLWARNPSEIASSSEDLPLPDAPVISVPFALKSMR
ncbi:hypothetical protein [Mycobacterium sherrisii]|uniref:hypothetical protein n=1 Tax=Mycobacterium sherrisii TaxID=243061 RepID=UPI001E34BFFF|nr:hypothetical protein [Mycobacterium sherrisii]